MDLNTDDNLKESLNSLLDSEEIDLNAPSTDQIEIDGETVTKNFTSDSDDTLTK